MKTTLADLKQTLEPIEHLEIIKGGDGEDDWGMPNRPMPLKPRQLRDHIQQIFGSNPVITSRR